MRGIGALMGLRDEQHTTKGRTSANREEHMGRKVELVGSMGSNGNGHEIDTVPVVEMPLKEQVIFTGSTDWSPEQAEHYIDWRIQGIDSEIARLRQQLDDLTGVRKRWLAVTGGRSKMFTNGNGHSAAPPA